MHCCLNNNNNTQLNQLGHNVPDHGYDHQPAKVVEIGEITIKYDMAVNTDRTIGVNLPDIAIHNRKDNSCLLIDGALGIMKIRFQKQISELPYQVSPEQIQKIALLGTAHILPKVLSIAH